MYSVPEEVSFVSEEFHRRGWNSYFVGGTALGLITGESPNDWDIEVFDAQPEDLISVCKQLGKVDDFGFEGFGVLRFSIGGRHFDISIPRRENKRGEGHTGFIVQSDPFMPLTEAASRRHFTIASMYVCTHTHAILDPFDGIIDLNNRILRNTSNKFGEDPIRVLIGMWYASKYLLRASQTLIHETRRTAWNEIHPKQEWAEWYKWAERSVVPSYGLRYLRQTGWDCKYPGLFEMKSTPQNPIYHPEGDVWSHTLIACDEARRISDDPITLFGALLHDIGKTQVTVLEDGELTSKGHDKVGVFGAESFLNAIAAPEKLIKPICKLVENHMWVSSATQVTSYGIRRLARRCFPATLHQLCDVMEADAYGRLTARRNYDIIEKLRETAQNLGLYENAGKIHNTRPVPIVMGRHLIDMGLKPGPRFSTILHAAEAAQERGEFADLKGGLKWTRENIKKLMEETAGHKSY